MCEFSDKSPEKSKNGLAYECEEILIPKAAETLLPREPYYFRTILK